MQLNSYLYPFMYIYFNDRCSCVAKMNNTLKVQMNDTLKLRMNDTLKLRMNDTLKVQGKLSFLV